MLGFGSVHLLGFSSLHLLGFSPLPAHLRCIGSTFRIPLTCYVTGNSEFDRKFNTGSLPNWGVHVPSPVNMNLFYFEWEGRRGGFSSAIIAMARVYSVPPPFSLVSAHPLRDESQGVDGLVGEFHEVRL